MTTDNNPANDEPDDLDQADASMLLLGILYRKVSELLTNPSRFTDPQELLVDLLVKYHDIHAALEQFLLLARIYKNLEHLTKPQLMFELDHASKTTKKLIGQWCTLNEITDQPQDAPQ